MQANFGEWGNFGASPSITALPLPAPAGGAGATGFTPGPFYSPYVPGGPVVTGTAVDPSGAGGSGYATGYTPGAAPGVVPSLPGFFSPTTPQTPGYTPEVIGPHWSEQGALVPQVTYPVDPVAYQQMMMAQQQGQMQGGGKKKMLMGLGGLLLAVALGYGAWSWYKGRGTRQVSNPRKPTMGQRIVGTLKSLPW